jgi:DNA-binding HxlR family transcriptional regulator
MELADRLQDRGQWSIGDVCSMSRVLELLSTKTTFVLLRELFFGTARFDDFVERSGSSAPAVSRALKQLEAAEIVARYPYQEPGQRVRDHYRLTEAGEALLPVFMALVEWGDTYLQNGTPPLAFVDTGSGKKVGVRVTADSGVRVTRSADILVQPND